MILGSTEIHGIDVKHVNRKIKVIPIQIHFVLAGSLTQWIVSQWMLGSSTPKVSKTHETGLPILEDK